MIRAGSSSSGGDVLITSVEALFHDPTRKEPWRPKPNRAAGRTKRSLQRSEAAAAYVQRPLKRTLALGDTSTSFAAVGGGGTAGKLCAAHHGRRLYYCGS